MDRLLLGRSSDGILQQGIFLRKNAKKILGHYGADLDNVVEEVLYVTNMDAALAVAGRLRKEAYGSQKPEVSSTLLETPRLALPHQLIEIKFIAKI